MNRNKNAFNYKHKVCSIFLLLTLVWLTISIPFVYAAQQQIAEEKTAASSPGKDDSSNNPFANTTEEKAGDNVNTIAEEFLHDTDASAQHFPVQISFYKCHHEATYIAFHGELISPPPEA